MHLYRYTSEEEIQCHTTTRRIRRLPRRIEFFQGTLDNTDGIESVRIFDTTLRDGEQSPRTSFDYDDKREIAEVLDNMGTHVIEAGFPVNSEPEFEAVSDIAAATDTTICGLARVVDKDIESAIDAGVDMVHVFVSTSDVQLQDSMHASREEAKERAVESVERIRDAGVEVMFSPMDATRTQESYLIEVIEAVDEAGVDWINIPDTCGVATPTRFAKLVTTVREHTDARVDVHAHDDFGLAAANAIAGFEAGAHQAQVSVNGIGERAGNAAYEEVVMTAESLYNVDTGIDTTQITKLARIVEEKSDIPIPANKSIVGRNAFAHESGIHAAGVIENSDTFEPGVMTPEMVGARREFVMGKHTGTHSVKKRLVDAGYDPTDSEVRAVTKRVKEFGAEKRRVTDQVISRFAEEIGVRSKEEVRI
ncbi:2-isopropylmalate synthase [Natronocalculus amylovorans]|uniref:Probable 2-isopropylmalate synthase n=1 Tax=Natronocalculus amylovorans TaxID=2917812 RepID=A0AAE3FY92_9EURY|nr:2-isopropylmalate synthase [Natronocalculus amylovorans]MCL9817233.1 2-isopropylmalate synthase [Natronocalculus amylovorans]